MEKLNMEQGAQIQIKQYLRYDPPMVKANILEGTVTKGDYIPEIGSIQKITDDGTEIEEAEARDKPYILTTHVSDDMFKTLAPHLQFKILLQLTERLHRYTKSLYNRHGINEELEDAKDDVDKDEDPLKRFYREYGLDGKTFNLQVWFFLVTIDSSQQDGQGPKKISTY